MLNKITKIPSVMNIKLLFKVLWLSTLILGGSLSSQT
jgi:hypothetical protein